MSAIVAAAQRDSGIEQAQRAAATYRRKQRAATLVGYAAMVCVLILVGVPLLWVLATSLETRPDIYTQPAVWWPRDLHPANYTEATTTQPFWTFLRNSLIVTATVAAVKFALGILGAYGLVFLRFPGKDVVFLAIVAALLVPNQITVISNYTLIEQLGWRNTFQGIIIPLCGVAFGTFLMRNHFLSLPEEVIDAARIDGAGRWQLLTRVVLPMSGPAMAAFAVVTLVNEWNEYLWPFLMADDARVATLPIGLTQLQHSENPSFTNWGPVMAGTVLTMLPMLVIFLILQRHMIKSLTAGVRIPTD
ncbi:carbohydrate ABC transporter permease [Nocardia mexicana]|uniref:Carbohydrate ABC transporter membrane protein 2 (CUT1 family) n=1 Tax=Nocardia mexicana TaxID=279262 RepID=A0A370GYD1_9NOCA|nr:carbohydrate ABC transporter permease [Nocardia mexicana]RDI48280.1 carbohydrate ABC transporter membrane protein 2 (CUT1 family) [Nocardia mexicana]